jgi:hypothetical protein
MVSNKLRARTSNRGTPYVCRVPKPIPPPPPIPIPPPPPWPLDSIAGHFHIQWEGGKGDWNEYDWDFVAPRLLPAFPHAWHVITPANGLTLEIAFVAHDLYDFLDIAFNDGTGSDFFEGTHLNLPTPAILSHYAIGAWDPIDPWNASALLTFDY